MGGMCLIKKRNLVIKFTSGFDASSAPTFQK
jgi:hypothetical protein